MNKVILPLFENMHGHLRQDELLKLFTPFAAQFCNHYVAMGNTRPPILTYTDARRYEAEIMAATPDECKKTFTPLVAIKVREDTSPQTVLEALIDGFHLFKFYPRAKTTHADDGIANYFTPSLIECYRVIAGSGGYALFHPEHPGARWDDTECEYAFFGIFEAIYNMVPGLNMVWEHLTDSRVLPFLLEMEDRVACTVTAHHLMLRLNDVLGKNHHLCRPPAKMKRDTETLLEHVVTGKSNKIMSGLDDAPHPVSKKHCDEAACGVWTTTTAPQLHIQIFEDAVGITPESLHHLANFVSTNARAYYKLHESKSNLLLTQKEEKVPYAYRLAHGRIISIKEKELVAPSDFVPFMAGETLRWRFEISA
jgi:dihydroorotase